MFERIISISSELVIIAGVLHLLIMNMLDYELPKQYTKVFKFWLLLSVLLSVVFYDKTLDTRYIINNAYTLMFRLLIAFYMYIMVGLATSWFTTFKKRNCKYNILMLLSFMAMNELVSSTSLMTLTLSYVALSLINLLLYNIRQEPILKTERRRYVFVTWIMNMLLLGAVFVLYEKTAGNIDFESIKMKISQAPQDIVLYGSIAIILSSFLFALNIAPFHILAEDEKSKTILPVSQFFAVIEPLGYWGIFFKFNAEIMSLYKTSISDVYLCFALLSLFIGAIGTNAKISLNKVITYSTIYYNGIILLLMSYFKEETDFSAFICLIALMLSLNSIYNIFYNLKSHGKYLTLISSLSGLAETRPYTTGALLVSLFSLIGMPPLAGFLLELNMLNVLIIHKSFVILGIVFLFLLFLAKAYLEIIKTVYFEQKIRNFDTESKAILGYILVSTVLILVFAFNPVYLISALKDLFYVIYL